MNSMRTRVRSLEESHVEALWGDGSNDDSPAIRSLFRGGVAFDIRAGKMLAAPALRDLPPGLYRLIPPVNAGTPGH